MAGRDGPVLIEIDDAAPAETPASAPPVPEVEPQTRGDAAAGGAGGAPALDAGQLVLAAAVGDPGLRGVDLPPGASSTGCSPPIRCWAGSPRCCSGAFVLVCLGLAMREWAAFARLARLDAVHRAADAAIAAGDLQAARKVTARVQALYAGRAEMRWALDRMAARKDEILDADGLLGLAEAELLVPARPCRPARDRGGGAAPWPR